MVYAGDPGGDPFDPAQWANANPSLKHFPSLVEVYQREAEEAMGDPSLLPEFLALRLNLGTVDHEIHTLVTTEQWQRWRSRHTAASDGTVCDRRGPERR